MDTLSSVRNNKAAAGYSSSILLPQGFLDGFLLVPPGYRLSVIWGGARALLGNHPNPAQASAQRLKQVLTHPFSTTRNMFLHPEVWNTWMPTHGTAATVCCWNASTAGLLLACVFPLFQDICSCPVPRCLASGLSLLLPVPHFAT